MSGCRPIKAVPPETIESIDIHQADPGPAKSMTTKESFIWTRCRQTGVPTAAPLRVHRVI